MKMASCVRPLTLDLPEHPEDSFRERVCKALGLPEVVYIPTESSPERRAEPAEIFSGDRRPAATFVRIGIPEMILYEQRLVL